MIEEAHPDSKYRCQGKGQGNEPQCVFLSMEGMIVEGSDPEGLDYTLAEAKGINRCSKCGGVQALRSAKKETVKKYRLTALKEEVARHLTNGDIYDLAEEIALGRALMERMTNLLEEHLNGPTFFVYIPQLERMLARIESLTVSYQKLMEKGGTMLSPEEATKYALRLSNVIAKYVPEDLKEAAAKEIVEQLNE